VKSKDVVLEMTPNDVSQAFGFEIANEVMNGSGVAQSVTEVRLMLLVAQSNEQGIVDKVLVFDAALDLLSKINKDSIDGFDLLIMVARRGELPNHPYLNEVGPLLIKAADEADEADAFDKALRAALLQEREVIEGIGERLSLATGKELQLFGGLKLVKSDFGLTLMFTLVRGEIVELMGEEVTAATVEEMIEKVIDGRQLPEEIAKRVRELVKLMFDHA
jgi:hypothetical protein